jgi:hypothetical protein
MHTARASSFRLSLFRLSLVVLLSLWSLLAGGCFGESTSHDFFSHDADTQGGETVDSTAPESGAPDATGMHDATTTADGPTPDVFLPDAVILEVGPPADATPDAMPAPAALRVTPGSYDFGSLTITTPSASKSFTVTNSGGVPTGIPSIAKSGASAADFAVGTSTCTAALSPGAACTFSVVFTPSMTGAESVTVTVSAASTTAGSASLSGTGLAPAALAVTPASHDFGSVIQGGKSSDFTFTVTNGGGVASGPLAVGLTGSSAGEFQLGSETCTGARLAAGGAAQCTIRVHFQPGASSTGAVQASLTVTGSPGGTATTTLSGTALALAAFSVAPSSYDFGSLTIASPSAPHSFTVTNTGGVSSGSPLIATSGANAGDFAVVTTTCTGALAPNGTCTFAVVFAPSVAAPESAMVTASAAATGSSSASISGTGLAPAALGVAPTSHAFGSITQGASSPDFTFTVTNGGGVATGPLAVGLSGSNASDFRLGTETCTGTQLAGGGAAQCTVKVHFQPSASATGPLQASLTVSGSPGGTATATVSGTALTPAALSITDANNQNPYDYGSIVQGTTTPAAIFTVTNSGGTASGTPSVTVTGSNGADFQVVSNTCTTSLAANGGQCQVGITFKPSTTSGEAATLTVSASPGNAPQVGLTGTGVAAVASITLSPTSWQAPATSETATNPPTTQQFTVTNSGTGATNALSITVLPNSGFLVQSDGCSSQALGAGGGTCTFTLAFQPTAPQTPGPGSATLTVTDSATDQQTAALSGVALDPNYYLVITPNPGDWGMVPVGTATPLTFTVTNYGVMTAPLIGGFTVVNAPNDPYFQPSTDTCGQQPLAAYGSAADACTHVETFGPPAGIGSGSLPTNPAPALEILDVNGAPLANVSNEPLSGSW